MTRQCHARILATVAALSCTTGGAAAQSSAADTVYHLHGSVIDGVSNAPIARALVQSNDRRIATMTDSEGRFSVDIHVPSRAADASGSAIPPQFRRYTQQLILTAARPGYLATNAFTSLPLDDTLSTTDVQLRLMPAATIDGRVSAAGADYASNVRLFLFMRSVDDDGNRTWVQAGFRPTNARGEFRFTNLAPGDYTLMTADWAGPEALPQPRNVISQRYPPVYSGDTVSLASATKIHVHYGSAEQVELHLHQATYFPVTVPVVPSSSANFVSARLINVDPNSGFQLTYNARLKALEGRLPNGAYSLLLGNGGPSPAFATVQLNVAGAPVRTAEVTLAPMEPILIRVTTQFTATQVTELELHRNPRSPRNGSAPVDTLPMPALQMIFRSADERAGQGQGYSRPSQTPGELIMQGVQPGRYYARPQIFRGYAASITSDGIDLLQRPLVIDAASPTRPIDVIVRDDTATLTGTVTSSSGLLPQQVSIVLIPLDAAGRYTAYGTGFEGKFELANIAPGTYRALAFRMQPHMLPYRDPDFLRRLDGKGATITATPGQQIHADIPLLNDLDMEEN